MGFLDNMKNIFSSDEGKDNKKVKEVEKKETGDVEAKYFETDLPKKDKVFKKRVNRKANKKVFRKVYEKKNKFGDTTLINIIKNPRFSDKSARLSQDKVYVFEVSKDSNKHSISQAFQKKYNVIPEKINISKNPRKAVSFRRYRGNAGYRKEVKKAYIYLKKGDTITVT